MQNDSAQAKISLKVVGGTSFLTHPVHILVTVMIEARHRCQRKCHSGSCGPCDGVTVVECRCGAQTTERPCSDVVAVKSQGGAEAVYTCDRRCNKKMSCSRHKCGQFCCVAADHQCRLICGCMFFIFSGTCGARGRCRITPPRFLAECRKEQLN